VAPSAAAQLSTELEVEDMPALFKYDRAKLQVNSLTHSLTHSLTEPPARVDGNRLLV
jgi:hypothetical protein